MASQPVCCHGDLLIDKMNNSDRMTTYTADIHEQ